MEKTEKRILIVDDDPNVLLIVKMALETRGYEVSASESPAEAMELLSRISFPVIISDIMMPDVDGFEFIDMVKKKKPSQLFIMLSAYISLETANKAVEAGVFSYLTKPVKVDELRKTVDNAFLKYRKENEK